MFSFISHRQHTLTGYVGVQFVSKKTLPILASFILLLALFWNNTTPQPKRDIKSSENNMWVSYAVKCLIVSMSNSSNSNLL